MKETTLAKLLWLEIPLDKQVLNARVPQKLFTLREIHSKDFLAQSKIYFGEMKINTNNISQIDFEMLSILLSYLH